MTTVRRLADVEGQPHANLFPDAEPKTIRLTLSEDEEVAPHSHPDREIVFYLVDGAIELRFGEETHDLTTGDIVRFDGDQEVAPRAIEDSTALIVLAKRTGD